MVRAILDGRKTMTRRVIFKDGLDPKHHMPWRVAGTHWQDGDDPLRCPYGEPGDRLWVRETWAPGHGMKDHTGSDPDAIYYRADGQVRFCDLLAREMTGEVWEAGPHEADVQVKSSGPCRWRSPIHMPRWVSRITLELTGVRVERAQDITLADCIAEGVGEDEFQLGSYHRRREAFRQTWDALNAKRGLGLDVNPWVWVLSFERTGTTGGRSK